MIKYYHYLFFILVFISASSYAGETPQRDPPVFEPIVAFSLLFGTLDFATSGTPKIFISKESGYSYWKTYAYGFGFSVIPSYIVHEESSLSVNPYVTGIAGLLIGNIIGYQTSKSDKRLSFAFNGVENVQSFQVIYRF